MWLEKEDIFFYFFLGILYLFIYGINLNFELVCIKFFMRKL